MPADRVTLAQNPAPAPAAMSTQPAPTGARRVGAARSAAETGSPTLPRTSVAVHAGRPARHDDGRSSATTVVEMGPTTRSRPDRSAEHAVRHVPLRTRPQSLPATGSDRGSRPMRAATSARPAPSPAAAVSAAGANGAFAAVAATAPAAAAAAAAAPLRLRLRPRWSCPPSRRPRPLWPRSRGHPPAYPPRRLAPLLPRPVR